jgi:hypothetical protein
VVLSGSGFLVSHKSRWISTLYKEVSHHQVLFFSTRSSQKTHFLCRYIIYCFGIQLHFPCIILSVNDEQQHVSVLSQLIFVIYLQLMVWFFGNLIFLVLITLNRMFLILSVLCQNSSSIFWKSYANAWKTCSKKFQFVQRWNLILISVVSEDLRRSIGSNFHFLICRKSQQLHMRAILINLPLMLLVIQARLLLLVDILHGIENMVADYLPKVTQLQWTVAIFLLCLKASVLDCAGCCHRQCHSFSSVSSCMYVSISSHS